MRNFLMIAILFQFTGNLVFAQEDSSGQVSAEAFTNLKGQVDGLNESYLETKSTVDKLSKIKVSGYVQAQWQLADSAGVPSMAGGNFPFNVLNWHSTGSVADSARFLDTLASKQRFMIRRARIKTTYDAGTSKYVLEIDVLPNGVGIKDANVTLLEPWLKTFSATLGIMDRPFGFEVPYSSASLETPERTRMVQTIFPGEKDLGVKLEANPTENMGFLQYLNFKGGFFTGMGGNTPNFNEVDNKVDFIGRGGFRIPIYSMNMEFDGGFSAYLGKVPSRSDIAFHMGDSIAAVPRNRKTGPANDLRDTVMDSVRTTAMVMTTGNLGRLFDRKVFGVDAQFYCDIPVIGGLSLRGEYDWGTLPGTLTSNAPFYASAYPGDLLERNMVGWYVMLVQNIGSMFQAVARYDVFDPNTDAKGSDIFRYYQTENEPLNHLQSMADLKFSTLGLGLNYYWDEHLRFTVYYDRVTNEKVNPENEDALYVYGANIPEVLPSNPLGHYRSDLSDNVFSFRAQFKF